MRAIDEARRFALQIAELPQLESFGRIPKIVTMLAPTLDARDLTSILVAVERALERRVRDEDFLPVRDDVARPVRTMPLRLVADSLRSSFNVGGLFRTAECYAAEELVLCGYSADPSDARVRKAALGTDEVLPWRRARRIVDEAARCRDEGRLVIALEAEAERTLADFDGGEPCALFVGNERHGLASSFVEEADVALRVPLFGKKNSLNVVSATAVALDAFRRCYDARARTISIRLDARERRMILAACNELGGGSADAVRAISKTGSDFYERARALFGHIAEDAEDGEVDLPETDARRIYELVNAVLYGLGDTELESCTGFSVQEYLALNLRICAAAWGAYPGGF